jgi:small subunit ribosomal protein S16
VVASLGHYNPHTKEAVLDVKTASHYLEHGAQPSDRVARLLKAQGVKLPSWVKLEAKQTAKTKNPEKLRKNRPAEPEVEKPAEEPAAEPEAPTTEEATPAETPAEPAVAEEPATEAEETAETTA